MCINFDTDESYASSAPKVMGERVAEDARIRSTEKMIKNSFLELLKEKPVDKITTTEICQKAGIDRATFYRHYENQYELYACLENEMLEELQGIAVCYGFDVNGLLEAVFDRFYQQREVWTLLLSDHGDSRFLSKFYAFFDQYFEKTDSTWESELHYRFFLYGISGLFEGWIKEGMKCPPQKMAAQIQKLRHSLIDAFG